MGGGCHARRSILFLKLLMKINVSWTTDQRYAAVQTAAYLYAEDRRKANRRADGSTTNGDIVRRESDGVLVEETKRTE